MDGHKIRLTARHLGRMIDDLERSAAAITWSGVERQEWCNTLRRLDLRGSPLDNSITREAITLMEEGELKPIPKGATMPKYKRIRGGGDLHYGNIGWWRFGNEWRTVCIDFGWHYVCNHVRVRCGARHLTEQFNDCV